VNVFLIDDLFLLPIKGVIWLGQKFHETAWAQTHDEGSLRKALDDLERQREAGAISEEEYDAQTAAIFIVLDEIRKHE
jgi:hypothetical protein